MRGGLLLEPIRITDESDTGSTSRRSLHATFSSGNSQIQDNNSNELSDDTSNSDSSSISLTTVFSMDVMTPTQHRSGGLEDNFNPPPSYDAHTTANTSNALASTLSSPLSTIADDATSAVSMGVPRYSGYYNRYPDHNRQQHTQQLHSQQSISSFKRRTLLTSLTQYEIRRDESVNNSSNRYHSWYEIIVISEPLQWSVWRRYSEFSILHKKLKQFVRRNENKGIGALK
uniref:PX domain-containing protein n=1 Tax=Lygus hesperus TaxID=30085 RepID=A0A0A9XXY3_LYGHE